MEIVLCFQRALLPHATEGEQLIPSGSPSQASPFLLPSFQDGSLAG